MKLIFFGTLVFLLTVKGDEQKIKHQLHETSSFQKDDSVEPALKNNSSNREVSIKQYSNNCALGTLMYTHGESFAGGDLDAPGKGPCIQCICNNGTVSCDPKICPRLKCSNPLKTSRDCCLVCPGTVSEEPNFDTKILFSNHKSRYGKSKDCQSGDRYFTEGSTWHPFMGPFGEMICVICKCRRGKIKCSRLKCLGKRHLPCDKPVMATGHCCPICPNQLQVEGNPMKKCISTQTDFLVWKSKRDGIPDIIQYLYEPFGTRYSDLSHEYHRILKTDGKIDEVEIMNIDLLSYAELKSKFNFKLLGGTTRKLLIKLKKNENELKQKCLEGAFGKGGDIIFDSIKQSMSCRIVTSDLESVLKLKKIRKTQWCGSGETEYIESPNINY